MMKNRDMKLSSKLSVQAPRWRLALIAGKARKPMMSGYACSEASNAGSASITTEAHCLQKCQQTSGCTHYVQPVHDKRRRECANPHPHATTVSHPSTSRTALRMQLRPAAAGGAKMCGVSASVVYASSSQSSCLRSNNKACAPGENQRTTVACDTPGDDQVRFGLSHSPELASLRFASSNIVSSVVTDENGSAGCRPSGAPAGQVIAMGWALQSSSDSGDMVMLLGKH